MQDDDSVHEDLISRLTTNFNILADEVQFLSDRKVILEHKLRYAHEQYQYLADRYTPSNLDTAHILAALQFADSHTQSTSTTVPLALRTSGASKQQTALAIRDGRRAASTLSERSGKAASRIRGRSESSTLSSARRTSRRATTMTTVFEQDFTIPGKMSKLQCPFAASAGATMPAGHPHAADVQSAGAEEDLSITNAVGTGCPVMDTDLSLPPTASDSATKCPIRYLDQRSPEEVAEYFETHKHEIPRSHEVCVKRYQRNEDDIRMLDAKYGNLVSMIQGLGAKHQPMLPRTNTGLNGDQSSDPQSEQRVSHWARAVSDDQLSQGEGVRSGIEGEEEDDEERESRFDRPLKEIRLGESPSRPWGIPVPFDADTTATTEADASSPATPPARPPIGNSARKCPFDHKAMMKDRTPVAAPMPPQGVPEHQPYPQPQKTESPPAIFPQLNAGNSGSHAPQMVFTGPVFIGYPLDQAMVLMQQWQAGAAKGT